MGMKGFDENSGKGSPGELCECEPGVGGVDMERCGSNSVSHPVQCSVGYICTTSAYNNNGDDITTCQSYDDCGIWPGHACSWSTCTSPCTTGYCCSGNVGTKTCTAC